jgi:GNAT superfamily N-acetyltransferase
MWGIEQDSKVAGIIGVEPMPGEKVIIRDLAVASELRRKGAGRAMIEFVRRHYRPQGVSGHTWSGALEFYIRCGFTIREDGALPSGEPRYAFEWRRT